MTKWLYSPPINQLFGIGPGHTVKDKDDKVVLWIGQTS